MKYALGYKALNEHQKRYPAEPIWQGLIVWGLFLCFIELFLILTR